VTLKLLTYNIRRGGIGREAALADVIRSARADIIVFQEATRPEVIERLAAETGMRTFAARPRTSLGFMSRVAIASYRWRRPRVSRHAFLEIEPAGLACRVLGVHLSAVHAAWTERRRVFELRALLAAIRQQEPGLHVLAGDFNTLAPGEVLDIARLPTRLRTLVWLSGGRIRWRTIQTVLEAGYCDAFRLLHPSADGCTFPTWSPHVRLDYVFLPAAFAGAVRAAHVVAGPSMTKASDHFPLLTEIDVPRASTS
jgi:exodeoxyribonuclease-3